MYGFVFMLLIALLLYVSLNEQIERQQKEMQILKEKIDEYEEDDQLKNTENE